MAQGNQRRESAVDNLAAQQVEVTARSAAPLRVPQVSTPDLVNSTSSKIARGLSQFSSQQFQNAANLQHEADALDGQMAHMQGQAMEDVEMEGNKWKLSGYRVMDAQSISSSMLAAQQEMIAQADYEKDPEAFRAQFVARMEAQIEGLDPQTARMVREQMASQLPALVGQHTQAHLKFQEDEAFKALERSVDVMGKDETALDAFIANVDGSGASAGLSTARRTEAVAAGVVRAFQAGNPLAYARILRADKLQEFSTSQIAAMQSAQQAHQTKLRTTANAEYIEAQTQLTLDLADGKLEAADAVAKLQALMSEHGMTMTMNEGMAMSLEQQGRRELYLKGNEVLYDNAMAMGDWRAIADMSFDTVIWHESRGNVNALGPEIKSGANKGDRALYDAQVMPKTAQNPGYGIKPADIHDKADVRRVGKQLWTTYLQGNQHSSGHFPWPPGDVEAAAVAYNAGPGNAKKWYKAGRNYAVLPDQAQTEPYAKAIFSDVSGGGRTISAKERLQTAANAAEAQETRLRVFDYLDMRTQQRELESQLTSGDLTQEEFIGASLEMLQKTERLFTEANVSNIFSTVDAHSTTIAKAIKAQTDAEADVKAEAFESEKNSMFAVFESQRDQLLNPTDADGTALPVDLAAVEALAEKLNTDFTTLADEYGYNIAESNYSEMSAQTDAALIEALKAQHKNQIATTIKNDAVETGSVADLPASMQDEIADQTEQEVITTLAEAQTSGVIETPEQMQEAFTTQMTQAWVSQGVIPPKQVKKLTSYMKQEPIAEDGTANADMVEAVQFYQSVKRQGGSEMTKSLFGGDDAAEMMAERIILLGNGDALEGVGSYGKSAFKNTRPSHDGGKPSPEFFAEAGTFLASEAFEKDVVGVWEAWWEGGVIEGRGRDVLPSESAARESEKFMPVFNEAVEIQMMALAEAHPQFTASEVGQQALRNIRARTEFVGGEMVIADSEKATLKNYYFAGSAKDPLVSAPGTMQNLVVSYLRDLSEDPNMDFIGELTTGEKTRGVARLVANIGENPVIAQEDAYNVASRGVRPFNLVLNRGPDGNFNRVAVEILLPDGTVSNPILIPQAYGAEYLSEQRKKVQK